MIISHFQTDIGKVRKSNEDVFASHGSEFFALADGMGGLPAGEVAAKLAVEAAVRGYQDTKGIKDIEDIKDIEGRVRQAVEEANRAVYQKAQDPQYAGMGTTLVVAVVLEEEAEIGNVGDSRAYLFRDGELKLVTVVHGLGGGVVTRAIGVAPAVSVDVFPLKLKKGDTILLCSDGLTNEISDANIAGILADIGNTQEAVRKKTAELISAANAAGGSDNITAGLIRYL